MTQVVQNLDAFCASLLPGDLIPTHTELMRRFSASERAIRWALDELRREGKIIRRQGAGTFVAERPTSPPPEPLLPPLVADSRTIVAIGRSDSAYFDWCLRLLVEQTTTADLSLVYRFLNPITELPVQWPLEAAPAYPAKGFILFSYTLAPLAKQLQDAGYRVALVGVPPSDVTPEVPCIYSNHEQGGYLATRHLLDLGHRHIAYLETENFQRQQRWIGHQRAIHEAQRKTDIVATVLMKEETLLWAKEPERTLAFFAQLDAPTGIVAWNDHEAALILSALSRAGIRVPDEVSLIGYDAMREGELVYPPLTTIDQAVDQQLSMALNLFTRPTQTVGHTVIILPTLIRRESTAPPPERKGKVINR